MIVSPEGGFQNVTEWAKKEICWQQVQRLRIPLDQEVAKQLVAREDDRLVKKEAESQQEARGGIEVQMVVVNPGGLYWKQLLTWAKARTLLMS